MSMTMRSLSCLLSLSVSVLVACGGGGGNNPDAPPPIDGPQNDMPVDNPPGNDGIADARAAADGTGLTLPIKQVVVTYLKPQIGSLTNDPAGFTIQAQHDGPALFIAVDPATLTPPAAVGDTVSFTITEMTTTGGQRRAAALSDFVQNATGANVGALAQDVSAATDLVSAQDNYDSELVTVTGTLMDAFAPSGGGFQKSTLATTGITGDLNLQMRAPSAVIDAIDMVPTCGITATNVTVGKFNLATQIGAYRDTDITLTGCPAPVVASAVATSATEVKITFSRHVKSTSVNANGGQFTFDNGLTASAATVNADRTVTVTTSNQTVGTNYKVTVANTVTDLQGSAVAGTVDATFPGFVAQAVVRINELNANIGNGCDLIELRVVASGSMTGFKLFERNGVVSGNNELNFTFPTFTVQKNDIIVVHTNSGNATCNPGSATAETTSVTDQPKATFGANFDTAFDFYSIDNGLTATTNVFTLFDATGAIVDAVFVTDITDAAAAATLSAAGVVGTANQWQPAQATYSVADFLAAAADDLNATGTAVTGNSIQRLNDADTNAKADWTTGAGAAPTFGLINVGQTPL
jgi:Big-like domain-containing protein